MDFKYLFTSFEGRIGRQQWWLGSIVLAVISWVVSFVIQLVAGAPDPATGQMNTGGLIILLVVMIPFMYAGIALSAKRWHDRGKSGWWILINLVPIIGGLWALVENGFLRGTDGPNQYGADPLTGK
jgi:uncharacterized membrane protein YhaH (DUF805 family)